ncbi:MAG TPA: TIGR02677 family protein [Kineosporiaceae bacterium]
MAGIHVPVDLFSFTVGARAPVYTAVLEVFGEAAERLETTLGLDDIAARLDERGLAGVLPDGALFEILKSLREWRLVDVTQNHAGNYRTAEDYERSNLQYSLSKRGEAALAGVQHAAAVLASTGALQTAVLDAVADRLAELAALLGRAGADDRRVFAALQELEGHLDALRTNTTQFNAQLQRLLRAEEADHATFREVKAATVAYLQEFLTNLDLRVHVISEAVAAVERIGVDRLHARALAGADLPSIGGEDPAPAWLAHRRARWEGLRAWFLPSDGQPPRAEQLHLVARRAIVTLLQALDRLNESRRRASSAAADLRELARWFSQAPTEVDVHRLWSAAFELGPARHAHLVHPDPELVPAGIAWSQAPPVPVSALLRSSGRVERFSRTGRVRDVTQLRRVRAERARAERAEIDRAWRSLATDGAVRLSQFSALDHATFEHLLDLLGRALSAPVGTYGHRRAVAADGRTEITLGAAQGGPPARIRTPRGELVAPDYVVRIATPGTVTDHAAGPPARPAADPAVHQRSDQAADHRRERQATG